MKETPFGLDFDDDNDDSFVLKEVSLKYLPYWPWFLGAILLCLGLGYVCMRYAPTTYESTAKIKIIDESNDLNIASGDLFFLGRGPINMENEIEVLTSYRMLSQVVSDLKLDIEVYELESVIDIGNFKLGDIITSQVFYPPFLLTKLIAEDSLIKPLTYTISLNSSSYTITDMEGQQYSANLRQPVTLPTWLPFRINVLDSIKIKTYQDITYKVVISSVKEAVLQLTKKLEVQPTSKKSEILSLSLEGKV